VKREVKKGKLNVELVTKFTPVGVVDDYLDPLENNKSKFSIDGKARHLSV
jgi:hypothetical protein